MSLKEAWEILDIIYGYKGKVHAQLKEKLMLIKLKAKTDAAREIVLFDEIQFIVAKLNWAGGTSMLTVDTWYMTLVEKYLSKDSLRE